MNHLTFSWWDYLLFVGMLGLSATIGIYYGYFGSKQTTASDYFYGGSKMNAFPVSMSLIASGLSGVALLGIPAEIYLYGFQFWTSTFSFVITGLITNFVYLPVFYNLKLESTYEYCQIRFDKHVRRLISFIYVFLGILETPFHIYAACLAINQVTGFNVHIITTFMSTICIFYTTIGGLKTVIWTDTLQVTVTLCSLIFIFIMGVISLGGFGYIWKTASNGDRLELFNLDPDPTTRNSFWTILIGQTIVWLYLAGINPAGVQRFVAVPTLRDSRRVLIIFSIGAVVIRAIVCYTGLIVYAKYFNCDPITTKNVEKEDQILIYFILDLANIVPGIGGLFISGLFGAGLSNLSTRLNTISGTMYTDLITPFISVETARKNGTVIMKIITVLIGVIAVLLIFVVEKLGTILELLITVNGTMAGAIIGIFTLGMLFPWANAKGALCGGILSLVLMTWIACTAQVYVHKHHQKPLETYGCNGSYAIPNTTISSTSGSAQEEPFWLFRISFHYFSLMGICLTLVIGLLVSCLTRKRDDYVTNGDLFSPCVRRYLSIYNRRAEYNSVERALQILRTTEVNQGTLGHLGSEAL